MDISRLEDKVDKVLDKISSIDTTLAAQHVELVNHIRRTQLLEEQMQPVTKHVNMVQGALKLIGLVAMLAAIAEGIAVVIDAGKGHL